VSLQIKKTLRLILISLLLCLLLGSPAAALAIKGFIAKDQNGSFYEYDYSDLLDSYALKIIGLSNGLYEDFSSKTIYAVLDSSEQLFEYHEIVNRYASALLLNQKFDLQGYFAATDAVKAAAPLSITQVSITAGDINHNPQTTSTVNSEPQEATTETPPAKTPILGLAFVTLEQAQNWARNCGAEQRFIDVATLYWDYGLLSGLRPEVLYAQAAVESDFGRFSNSIPPEHNNWAGIKTAAAAENETEEYEHFPTPEEGVRAHYNHMSAYVGYSPVGEPHGRYHLAVNQPWAGQVLYVEDLSNHWSPLADYHLPITEYLTLMNNTVPGILPAVPTVDVQSPESEEAASDHNTISQVVVDVNILHLRSGPSTDYEILERLPLGTRLTVKGSQNEWLMVDVDDPDGKSGWVHGAYVRVAQQTSVSLQARKIVIDPGHGGSDPGARGTTGVQEKIINLSIAQKLVGLLEEAGATVILTRSGDQTVNNQQRVDLANNAGADLMISIHANAFFNPESNGTETFYCAKNQNSAASRLLALQLQRELVAAIELRNRGVKSSSFFVLNKVNLPAALVEVAFLSNPTEEAILLDPGAQSRVATALYRGIEAYFGAGR
jgi:N-acetylmuramoyl-L-alanine amidase CwlD